MDEFSSITQNHIAGLNIEDRKKLGQYMTPQSLGLKMAALFTNLRAGMKVLDPAAGTGELLRAFQTTYPTVNPQLHGWDVDLNMLKVLKQNLPTAATLNRSLYDPIPSNLLNSFDVIIGNPPYFEVKKTDPGVAGLQFETTNERGRLNVYALFFEYALKVLKPGGELVFLIPPSMNNGAFFTLTRKHILENAYIKHLEVIRDNRFADAQTSTQILHLVKTVDGWKKNLERSSKFVFDFNQVVETAPRTLPTIFTPEKDKLTNAWVNRASLFEQGYQVKTGSIVWNKHKTLFQSLNTENTAPLVYSKDITNQHTIKYNERLTSRRFLPTTLPGLHTEPVIVMNRIVGSLTNPNLKFALVNLPKFYTENHVNVITSLKPESKLEDLVYKLNQSKAWLPEYLQALTGNTQLSGTELQYLLPF